MRFALMVRQENRHQKRFHQKNRHPNNILVYRKNKTSTRFKAHLRTIDTPQSFLQKSTPMYTDPDTEKGKRKKLKEKQHKAIMASTSS